MTSPSRIDIQTRVVQVKDVLSSAIDDDLVLMSIESDKYYGFDAISRRIWELVSEPSALTDVCEQLLTEYNVDRDTCQDEVLAFVQQLLDENLVQVVEA